jgi:limonene 1,2-monooxygenase
VEDAVNVLNGLWAKSGGFGCILIQQTHWADEEASRRSYQAFVDEVMPAFTGQSKPRQDSHAWTHNRRTDLTARVRQAAAKTIEEHFAESGASTGELMPDSR